MRVSPINDYLRSILVIEPDPLDPPENPFINPARGNGNPPSIENLLNNIQKIRQFYIQHKIGNGYDNTGMASDSSGYGRYLQFPNREIRDLARSIVKPSDNTDDEKAYAVLMWVQENIQYVSDIDSYGRPEYWALPTMTVTRGEGDCEDGAFLIHSLMLHAGIPHDRVRTYGGSVFAGPGAPAGGHAWTAYIRESDDEWVDLDWCYYPDDLTVEQRTPLREKMKYYDDWFYVDALKTVDATYTNNLRTGFLSVLA